MAPVSNGSRREEPLSKQLLAIVIYRTTAARFSGDRQRCRVWCLGAQLA